jgi:cyclase
MLRPRITPCLLVHDAGLVKTVRFGSPRYVGDPLNAVRIFSEKEADEIIVLDIDATVRGVEPDYTLIARLAAECRMPLCYGGGVRTVEQAGRIVRLGAEKVALSAAAIGHPELVRAIAGEIGQQSVVLVLDVRPRAGTGHYGVWTHNGSRDTGRDLLELARAAESMGAGELLVNAIERDGTMQGYDLDLARAIRAATQLPITLLGGAGSLTDIGGLVASCGVVGAAAGSLFVFKGPHKAVLINYPDAARKDVLLGEFANAWPGGSTAPIVSRQ